MSKHEVVFAFSLFGFWCLVLYSDRNHLTPQVIHCHGHKHCQESNIALFLHDPSILNCHLHLPCTFRQMCMNLRCPKYNHNGYTNLCDGNTSDIQSWSIVWWQIFEKYVSFMKSYFRWPCVMFSCVVVIRE